MIMMTMNHHTHKKNFRTSDTVHAILFFDIFLLVVKNIIHMNHFQER